MQAVAPQKILAQEMGQKKNSQQAKNPPPPPITFLMVRPLNKYEAVIRERCSFHLYCNNVVVCSRSKIENRDCE